MEREKEVLSVLLENERDFSKHLLNLLAMKDAQIAKLMEELGIIFTGEEEYGVHP